MSTSYSGDRSDAVQRYAKGSLREDAAQLGRGGWILGSFYAREDAESLRATNEVEVKYWEYARGDGHSHQAKTSSTIEWTYIVAGRVRARLGRDFVILGEGEYVIIQPGTLNNVVEELLEDTRGITVKAPSDPEAKRIPSH